MSADVVPIAGADAPTVVAQARPSRMSPLEAANHIASLHTTGTLFLQTLRAQIMECCSRIWSVCDESEAERLIRERTPLSVSLSRRYADCWAAARNNRELLDLAGSRPSEALRLVEDVAEAMEAEEIGDDVGREAARIVSLPRRRRAEALDELIAARDSMRTGRDPADVARIEELEDSVAALEAERAARSPSVGWTELHGRMASVLDELDAILDAVRTMPESPRHDDRVLRWCDSATALVDVVAQDRSPQA